MNRSARDLLLVLLLLGGAALAWRGARSPPRLGPPAPVASCAVPVERAGQGVACWTDVAARAAGLHAGDRIEPSGKRARMAPERLAALGVAIDVNHASAAELTSLEGIGPKLARRIVRARPFVRLEELGRVRGIGGRRLARLRARLRLRSD